MELACIFNRFHECCTRTVCAKVPRTMYMVVLIYLLLVKHGTCQTLDFNVSEGLDPGTLIVKLPDVTQTAPPYNFFFAADSKEAILNDLNLDKTTGEIKTKVKLDRETLDLYRFVVSSRATLTVTIHVLDINDNSPTFSPQLIKKSLPESTPPDHKIALGSATDPDLGQNTTQGYEIISGNANNAFRLSTKKGKNGILFLDLEINGGLDYEETQRYDLVIRAYDGGMPRKYGTLNVDITVSDTNDNQPTFNQSRYSASVKENATIGSSVLQVYATDRDSGENGRISYSIDRQKSDPQEKFDVNPTSGLVTVNKELDYETKQNYELIVIAQDNGTQKLQTTAIVSVQVEDVNDNNPTISIAFIGDGSGRISETAQPGQYIARISVSDPDVPDYDAKVNVSLQGGDGHFGLITTNNVVYLVILSRPLDREVKPSYTLTVVATDSGTPPLVAKESLSIKVKDVNDNAPEFSRQVYYADIQEVVPPGSSVYQLAATDKDEGNNSLITYRIFHTPQTHSDWFQIDNKTGLITTKTRLDCETASEPRLYVQATDNGSPPLSANATVVVRIMDVNDNQPVFHQSFYNVTVAENVSVGKCILKVEAEDPDCGGNAKVAYSIATNMGFQNPTEFEIRSSTGEICVIRPIDFETISSYEFPVLAKDPDAQSSTAMVKIVVEDVNDNRPVFYPTHISVSVNLNSQVGTEVAVVHASDKDSGTWGLVRYQFVSGNSQNLFWINPKSGVIKLNKRASTQGVYTLMVQATDGGGLISSVNANISISVVTSAQRPAQFNRTLYKWTVLEDVERNHEVGTVTATNPGGGGGITYSIVSGDPMGYFSIVPSTGVIKVNTKLDADTHPYVLLSLQAQAGNPPSYGRAQVNISIIDVNDNYPQFTISSIEIPIKEDASLTETIYAVQATDKDSGRNGQVRYGLIQGQDIFSVDLVSGQLKLRRKLDYESQKKHEVKVMAFDLGNPSMNSTMSLIIDVQDVNDNEPKFNQSVYVMNIYESIPVNSKFGKVFATDRDSGNNARLTYRLSDNANMEVFGIFSDEGSIYNKVLLDREQKEKYDFRVVAIDNGIPSKSATALVTVNILDANDNSPEFYEKSYTFYLQEESATFTVVGTVSAFDPDQTDNQHLRYSLISSNPNFRINEVSGKIQTMLPIDREIQEVYEFVVSVTDGGDPPRQSSVPVKVVILDINDHAPVFEHRGAYQVNVKENEPKGTTVIQVSAYDTDKGENKTVVYTIANVGDSTDASKFNINPQTGWITTKEMFNHETKNRYIFSVVAIDGGKPPRQAKKTVEVTIVDINESPPIFDTASKSFLVKENTPPGTKVGSVKAHDKDSGENGRVNYYIISGNLYGTFGVNHSTGQIFIASQVDYEICSLYLIQIRAVDNSNINPLSSKINVNITIQDLNDNIPTFEDDPITFHIAENTRVGEHVWTFTAVDRDSRLNGNGRVRYSIVDQSPSQNWFEIDPSTGILKTLREIDFEQTRHISITVKATDQPANSVKQLWSTATALIMIKDVNDNAPIFQSRSRVYVFEDEPVGYPAAYIVATDADWLENSRITYILVSGNEDGHFALDPNTGRLTIVRMLDRETKAMFTLNISASDHGNPRRTSFQSLFVFVEDVNDNPPVFDHSVYKANITENGNIGELVKKIHATDKDVGDNGNVSYIIPYGIADSKFSVQSTSGEIRTNASLDREEQDSWIITAYARDGTFPALYDITTILVNVLDDNDNFPIFKNPTYYLEVPENAAVSVIHTVHAMDSDIGKNGQITYAIIGGNFDNKFSINPTSGAISCKPLDREERASYKLTIEARDGGSPPKRNTSQVTIKVLDENDNNPDFERDSYSMSIREDEVVGKSLMTIRAIDRDEGINSRIMYSFDNASVGQFKIDNTTGVITTDGLFDREKKSSYRFEAHAIDGGLYGPRSDKVTIQITIIDVNDNAPVFEQIPYRANISQNYGSNQYVTKVRAADKDVGPNGLVRYSFVTPNSYFKIDINSGEITTSHPLQSVRSAVGLHRIEVMARDSGSPALSSTGVVEILVGNAPGISTLRFSNLTYNVYLPENSRPETYVVTVSAKFVTGTPSSITYSFANGHSGYSEDNSFSINSVTGRITVNDESKLDFETTSRMRLIVIATASKAYGYTTVWVNLKDQNDNPPKFTHERYTSSVWEGNKRGTYVTQIIASDIDEGANGHVSYSIIGGNTHDAFIIDPPNTGFVKTNIILDREIKDSYRLEIEAIDHGNPQRSSTCFLKITVIDINDNEPTFPNYGPLKVKEGTELGTDIIHMTANDIDLNPTLTYNFTPDGNPDDTFSIDRYSGRILLAKALDYEKKSSYRLRVQVSDSENINTQALIVNVVDENDNPPEFTQQSYQVTVKEMTPPHYPIITVNSTDGDSGDNARITYSMVWLDGFYIDSNTGTIYTNKTITFNPSQPTVHLVVTAHDHGTPSLSAVVAVKVQTIDINNHRPQFIPSQYSAKMKENAQTGELVVRVTAEDKDDSVENKRVDFSIVRGNEQGVFRITSSTGEIFLNGPLDRENEEYYSLVVMAKDRGQPPLSSNTVVTVQVLDVNDNSPVFKRNEYKTAVNESVDIGWFVIQVTAVDDDAGDNGRVQYEIASGNDDYSFDIEPDTGKITTRRKLDHETSELHRLIIKATDSSKEMSRLSAFTSVIINVTDVNEHRPGFPVMMYLEHVYENEPVGTHVFTAHANDQDSGYYGKVEYQLQGHQNLFQINRYSGEVLTAARLDYEVKNKYVFDVMAIDRGGFLTRVPAQVTIEPKDEFKPEFEKEMYNFSCPGNAKKGYVVGRIQATDKDGSSNANIVYSLQKPHEYFAMNDTTGVLLVSKDLQQNDNRKKRQASLEEEHSSRHRRALKIDMIELEIVAKSGARASSVKTVINVNRTCAGCQVAGIKSGKGSGLSGTALVLVIVFVIVAIVLIIIIVVMYLRGRERKKHQPASHGRFDESINSIDVQAQSLDLAPPAYNDIPYHHHQHPLNPNNITTSEMSDQSHSASSGRGSAEDAEDEDEEIRMINSTPMRTSALVRSGMPDSGIQNDDDDTKSELSVQNHQEYLARLGIDASKISSSNKCVGVATSVESMHQFSEEGGGEGDGLDIENLVYAKLDEVEADENLGVMDGTRQFAFTETEPSHAGSLSSVINSEEELSGSYNWDYLLDWGPQYQPLAHVFAEIARLKDDSVQPRKQPTKIVPQNRAISSQNPQQVKTFPPPIITNAPPRIAPQPMSSHHRSSHSNSTINSGHTTHLTSLPSLPRSPISYESSYTSLALTPSFTPSLSPLATRSPSISPLVSPKGIGSSGPSSGLDTPKVATSNPSIRGQGSSESEQELHI